MNAVAVPYIASPKRPDTCRGAFLLIVMLTFLLVAAIVAVIPLHYQAKGITIRAGSSHGNYAHGDEGPQARNCLEQHGISLVYREPNGIVFHFLCQSDDGSWFDIVARKISDDLYEENTALEPKSGVLKEVLDWLTSEIKGATKFTQIEPGTPVTILP
jgi:hypothetical protein